MPKTPRSSSGAAARCRAGSATFGASCTRTGSKGCIGKCSSRTTSCSRTWRLMRAATSSSISTTSAWPECVGCSKHRRERKYRLWMQLRNKTILITGGARGLGRAFAEAAVSAGADVVLADVLDGTEVAKNIGARFVGVDLASPASIEKAAGALGKLDGLVNNAAITNSGGRGMQELDVETW